MRDTSSVTLEDGNASANELHGMAKGKICFGRIVGGRPPASRAIYRIRADGRGQLGLCEDFWAFALGGWGL